MGYTRCMHNSGTVRYVPTSHYDISPSREYKAVETTPEPWTSLDQDVGYPPETKPGTQHKTEHGTVPMYCNLTVFSFKSYPKFATLPLS